MNYPIQESLSELVLDPIIQNIFDSKRLIFEDETTIRHRIQRGQQARGNKRRDILAATSGLFLATGGLLQYFGPTRQTPPFSNIKEMLKTSALAAGTVGVVGIIANEILRKRFERVVKQSIKPTSVVFMLEQSSNQSVNQSSEH